MPGTGRRGHAPKMGAVFSIGAALVAYILGRVLHVRQEAWMLLADAAPFPWTRG